MPRRLSPNPLDPVESARTRAGTALPCDQVRLIFSWRDQRSASKDQRSATKDRRFCSSHDVESSAQSMFTRFGRVMLLITLISVSWSTCERSWSQSQRSADRELILSRKNIKNSSLKSKISPKLPLSESGNCLPREHGSGWRLSRPIPRSARRGAYGWEKSHGERPEKIKDQMRIWSRCAFGFF